MNVSDDFYDAMSKGGSMVRQDCMCGRVYFCNPEISHGDYEEGEYEILKKLSEEQPKKYIETDYGCIDFFTIGDSCIVWDCDCHNDIWYEHLLWSSRKEIMDYLKNRLKTVEKSFWELATNVNDVNFGFENESSDKYTYEEFINRMREYKMKDILG